MKAKKFNILKTFEIFNSESVSILKDKVVNLIFVETENFFIKYQNEGKSFLKKIISSEPSSSIQTDLMDNDAVQLTVVGNKNVYNLLSFTLRKYKES